MEQLYESHSHTPLCRHAVGEPTEYAATALARGLRGIVFTCHNPMPNGFSSGVRMRLDQFDDYVQLIADTRDEWTGRVDVRLGLEADYFAGYESFLEKQLGSAEFHYVLGSVHPQTDEFRERYWNNDLRSVQRTYFRLLADAAETGLFDSLAHPDLVKNVTAAAWDPESLMDTVCESLDRIAKTGVAMELNTSGLNKTIRQMNPFPEMLSAICQRGIPVTLGADAHDPSRVADGFEAALDLLDQCGFRDVNYYLNRERHAVSIAEVRASLVSG